MKKFQKFICLVVMALILAGCGKAEPGFQVLFAAPYVSDEMVAAYGEQLAVESEIPVTYSGFSIGSQAVDPMIYGAGTVALTAMITAGEVDVLVCDLDEAPRYARSGMFYDLTEIFSGEELAKISDRLLTFEMVDETGTPTGEFTAPCGLELPAREDLTWVMGGVHNGIFITCGAGNLDLAKEMFWQIVSA